MFRPDKVILRPSKKTDSRVVYKHNSWICLLGGSEDNIIRSKHVDLTKYTTFVYK